MKTLLLTIANQVTQTNTLTPCCSPPFLGGVPAGRGGITRHISLVANSIKSSLYCLTSKYYYLTLLIVACSFVTTQAQNNVGIGTTTPNSKAILELKATDKGFMAPRMNTPAMLAIATTTTEAALLIYNTDSACYHFYNGTAWKNLCDKSIDTALLNKAIKKYLNSNSTTIINILKGDTALFNYTNINNAVINILTVDTSITNIAIINNANINILKVDSSTTNYAYIKNGQIDTLKSNTITTNSITANTFNGGVSNMDSLYIGGQNILQTITDSIAAQAWLLKGNNASATNKLGTLNARDLHIVANSAEKITILSGTGYVGINQALPSQPLDVTGNLRFTGALMPNTLAGTTGQVLTSAGAGVAPTWTTPPNVTNTTITDSIKAQAWLLKGNAGTVAGTNFIGTTDAQDFVLKTNGVENMRIFTTGAVAIGTPFTPTGTLEVVDQGYNRGIYHTNYMSTTPAYGGVLGMQGARGTLSTPTPLQLGDGLGYLSFASYLGTAFNTSNSLTGITSETSENHSATQAGSNLKFLTTNNGVILATEKMRIESNGNVGIGTTTPIRKLDINGDGINLFNTTNTVIDMSVTAGDLFRIQTDVNGLAIYDITPNLSRLTILNNGNVGIGQNAPNNKLEITHGTTGNSGLRLTNLPNASVLSTDANGDVIPASTASTPTNGLFWGLTGNSGTNSAINFMGTTDNQDVVFKRNGLQSGLINNALQNTAFGVSALNPATTGTQNTAYGYASLAQNTTGTTNTAVGTGTLQLNTTGAGNVAIGALALTNSLASANTAVGAAALKQNTTGTLNVALGDQALANNTTGNENVGLGHTNLRRNTVGSYNTALGLSALYNNTTGNYNTSIGYNSGAFVSTTGNNTFLGALADATDSIFTNATAIGYNAKVGASNSLILGGTAANKVNVGIGTTAPSAKLHVSTDATNDATLMVGGTFEPSKIFLHSLGDLAAGTGAYALYNYRGFLGFNTYYNSTLNKFVSDHDGGSSNAGSAIYQHSSGSLGIANFPITGGAVSQQNNTNDLINNTTMVLTAAHTVGIGTLTPPNKLSVLVNSDDRINITQTAENNFGLTLAKNVTAGLNNNTWQMYSNAGTKDLHFWNSTLPFPNVALTLQAPSGNIGIGTTAPSAKLYIKDAAPAGSVDFVLENTGGGGQQWVLESVGTYGGFSANGSFAIGNRTNSSHAIVIQPTGNVGIGTASPTQKLHLVDGSVLTENSNGLSSAIISTDGQLEIFRNQLSTPFTKAYIDFKDNAADDLDFRISQYNPLGNVVNQVLVMESTLALNSLAIRYDNGNIGMGTNAPTQKLHVIGNILASGTITPSDARYKQNVTTLQGALTNVLKLRGVTYDMKAEYKDKGFGQGTQVGVIAQEVEAVYPQLINTSADGYKGVDYSKFTPILIEAIKELKAERDTDKKAIEELRKEIEALKRK